MRRKKRNFRIGKTITVGIELLDRAEEHMYKADMSFTELVRTALTFYLDVDDKAKDTDE